LYLNLSLQLNNKLLEKRHRDRGRIEFSMGFLSWILGKPISPAELVRKNQRAINKAIRDLDRERFKMEQQEKKLIVDVKKSAGAGQMVHYCAFIHYLYRYFSNIFFQRLCNIEIIIAEQLFWHFVNDF